MVGKTEVVKPDEGPALLEVETDSVTGLPSVLLELELAAVVRAMEDEEAVTPVLRDTEELALELDISLTVTVTVV